MKVIAGSDWQAWIEVQKAATLAGLIDDDLSAAIALLNKYLEGGVPTAIQREAIAYRGTLLQEYGELERAKDDFVAAWRLAEEGYIRFELENTLAEISSKLGDATEADKWYSAALGTGAADPRVAGGGFLLRFLHFRGERGLSGGERQLAEKMVHQGWHLLRVEGALDLSDLKGAARQLVEAQQKQFSADRPPAPQAHAESPEDF